MRNRRSILSIAALMTALALVGSAPSRGTAQVAPPSKIDTVKKPANASTKRIKIKKDSAGGDVCLPAACVTPEPSMATTTMLLEREAYARDAQRVLDSIETEARVRTEIARV